MQGRFKPNEISMRIWKILLFLFLLSGCREHSTPKPRGFFRIEFPQKSYHELEGNYPYSFEIPDYSVIRQDDKNPEKQYWINVDVPANKAELHLSFYNLNEDSKQGSQQLLVELMEETRSLAYKHSIKADAIDEQIFVNPGAKVYGTIYAIKGNAASPIQFFLTDSTTHFLRGALYISEVPDIDSLQPVIDFLEPDIIRLIETTSWK